MCPGRELEGLSSGPVLPGAAQISSLEDADAEIDKMQREGRLDPAMMLTMAKAYSGVKESPYVQEEVCPRSSPSHPNTPHPPSSCGCGPIHQVPG